VKILTCSKTMPLCEHCDSAIQALYPGSITSRNRQVVILQLPILGRCDVNNCWVCFKLSTCLESEDLDAFSRGKTDPLSVRLIPNLEARLPTGGIVSSRIIVGVELDGRTDSGQFGELDLCFITRTGIIIAGTEEHSCFILTMTQTYRS
jgi:hypothetical protein